MPFFGRSFDCGGLSLPFTTSAGWDYKDVADLPSAEWTRVWDDEAQVPYKRRTDGTMIICYDDLSSVSLKCQYVKDKALRGGHHLGARRGPPRRPLRAPRGRREVVRRPLTAETILFEEVTAMHRTGRDLGCRVVVFALAFALLGGRRHRCRARGAAADRTKGFFPVSVWYAGGKARAPMLETVTPRLARGLEEGHRPDQAPRLQHRPDLDRVDGLRAGRRQV